MPETNIIQATINVGPYNPIGSPLVLKSYYSGKPVPTAIVLIGKYKADEASKVILYYF